nr:PREDICTED: protein D3-like isoform X2 [Bemisia tabaci]
MLAQKCSHFPILSAIVLLLITRVNTKSESLPENYEPDHKTIRAAMEEHRILPDIHKVPISHILKTNFKSGKFAMMGNELSREDTKELPQIVYPYQNDSYYAIVMSDLDAPTPNMPFLREWQNWLIVNIPGGNLPAGETLSEYIAPAEETASDYIGPGSKNFTGNHRYVITAYRQPGPIKFDDDHLDNKSDYGRICHSTNMFATDNELGNPWAVNFWYTAHDTKRS